MTAIAFESVFPILKAETFSFFIRIVFCANLIAVPPYRDGGLLI